MKQTILHISNNHSSFDDRIFYKELVSLSKYYDCYLISGGGADGMLNTMGKDLRPAGVYNNVNILPYPLKNTKNIFIRAIRKFFPHLFNIMFDGFFYRKLKKLCVKNNIKPSILHYHDLDFSKIAQKLRKYFNCKLIFDCHEFYFSYFFENKLSYRNLKKSAKSLLFFKNAVRNADAVISVTKNLDNIISLMNNNKEHIVVYNSSLLPITNNNVIDTNKKIVLLHEGSMKFNRGLRLMMELFSDNYFRDNVKLKIVGGIFGEENIFYKQKINEYCIDESMIELTGHINYEDIHKHLTGNIGIIFFEKAFNAYYSMPNKLFNYINAGLPILSVQCAELSDFISDNKIGYNVERNINFIKEGINKIITNYDYYKKNIVEAQKLYTWENDQNKLLSLYDGLLK
jgi:alpha-maltose-1-phosphate synthase